MTPSGLYTRLYHAFLVTFQTIVVFVCNKKRIYFNVLFKFSLLTFGTTACEIWTTTATTLHVIH